MRTSIALLAAAAALVATPAVAAAPTVKIAPADLPRGEDVTVPHVEGRTVVDGDTRIRVDADWVLLLGVDGDEYVVQVPYRILRVSPGDSRRVTRVPDGVEARLSRDAAHVVLTRVAPRGSSTIRVLDSGTGREVATRTFQGYAVSLDADGNRVVVSTSSPDRTLWWNFGSDRTRGIVPRHGGIADIRADRLATFTGDPYQGGCTVVTSLTRPGRVLWRSCEDGVWRFSPNGARMVTAHILTDGLGPGRITLRRAHGRALTTYETSWFTDIGWESRSELVFVAHTRKRSAYVRCVLADCERASRLRKP